jgi:hypothetical protein
MAGSERRTVNWARTNRLNSSPCCKTKRATSTHTFWWTPPWLSTPLSYFGMGESPISPAWAGVRGAKGCGTHNTTCVSGGRFDGGAHSWRLCPFPLHRMRDTSVGFGIDAPTSVEAPPYYFAPTGGSRRPKPWNWDAPFASGRAVSVPKASVAFGPASRQALVRKCRRVRSPAREQVVCRIASDLDSPLRRLRSSGGRDRSGWPLVYVTVHGVASH